MMIEVENLNFSYESTPILQNINVSVAEGEFIGIFGPNGGGKTTFLKLLMGFLKPLSGSIKIHNHSPKTFRKKIGYVPQVSSMDKQFPISSLELVLMGCLSQGSWWGGLPAHAKQKALHALELVGLSDKSDAAFGTLSGGQAQRVLIARALATEPELLILDEPTASVDPNAKKEIYQILSSLKGKMTILMVTHDLDEILQQTQRLLCINRQVSSYFPKEVCEHFTMGLYHL
jgi:zinc transport system ATP-binding protein